MPQMGESIFEGTITKWLKKVGDTVQKDEPLFEISTDKVDAEIPSPIAGVLTEIKAAEGTTVEVNTVVAVIGGSASGNIFGARDARTSGCSRRNSAAAAGAVAFRAAQSSPSLLAAGPPHREGAQHRPCERPRHRLRRPHHQGRHPALPQPACRATTRRGPVDAAARQSLPQPKALTAEVVPLTKMRAIIAQRMVESKRISPHVHSVYKIDMTRIARLREREKAAFEQRHRRQAHLHALYRRRRH